MSPVVGGYGWRLGLLGTNTSRCAPQYITIWLQSDNPLTGKNQKKCPQAGTLERVVYGNNATL